MALTYKGIATLKKERCQKNNNNNNPDHDGGADDVAAKEANAICEAQLLALFSVARAAGSGPRGSRSKHKGGSEGVRRGLGVPRTGVARAAGSGPRGSPSKTQENPGLGSLVGLYNAVLMIGSSGLCKAS